MRYTYWVKISRPIYRGNPWKWFRKIRIGRLNKSISRDLLKCRDTAPPYYIWWMDDGGGCKGGREIYDLSPWSDAVPGFLRDGSIFLLSTVPTSGEVKKRFLNVKF